MLRTSLIRGMEVFLLSILMLSSLKFTTDLQSLVSLWVINITSEVRLVLLCVSIPNETNLSICLSMKGFSFH